MSVPAVELVGITKRFGDVTANDGVDLAVERGEVHAVVGENGAGKSTLMSILYGLHPPDAGHVLRAGTRLRLRSPADAIAHGLGMVHQRFRLFPGLSVAENVVLGAEPMRRGVLDRAAARRSVADLAERYGLDVDPGARIGDLPVGTRQRVEILKALYRRAEVLILDEPTAVLTPGEAAGLFRMVRELAAEGVSVLLVTHKLDEVLAAGDRVTVLRGGRVTGRFPTAGTSADDLVRAMIGRSLATAPTTAKKPPATTGALPTAKKPPATTGVPPTAKKPPAIAGGAPYRLEVRDLRVRDRDGVAAVGGVSFSVRPGEIVGIAGVAGSGQRELVDVMTGLRRAHSGTVLLDGRPVGGARDRRVAYVPGDRAGRATAPDMSLADNLLMGDQRGFLLGPGRVRGRAAALVERFSIRAASVRAPIAQLSGGNAQKAVLARELSRDTPVLVVEEPTQGVDVGAQEQIHALLAAARDAGRAVLLQSSELSELRALADRVLVMFEGRLTADLPVAEATDERLGAAMTGATGVRRPAGESTE
ncbi:ABC transporter ATP-binding protein [Nonomuraea glycinis]|uniref:Heme ABC transporter ATP-binding protein n=1 Tax=Nonomuraea glycinis TaxID=2047744 RepID=A0A918A7U5_9ACTN|nr:ABC transporter ATP-binding protein [Nonomuraea glycinis]MCA2176229.1 ABC transporter ATP-binding protein [Nonomuraea glycinis]GGP07589.1 heme ABC transporter ATP-binding protein [Nonomuraea glycinis]